MTPTAPAAPVVAATTAITAQWGPEPAGASRTSDLTTDVEWEWGLTFVAPGADGAATP